jgi:hypothetical protein
MRKKVLTVIAGAALFGCEVANSYDRPEAQSSFIGESFDDRRIRMMHSPHIHMETHTMTVHVEDSIATHVGSTEGSLDLFRENHLEPGAVPEYKIHFLKYVNFRNGAQQAKRIVSALDLVAYVVEIGFAPENAMGVARQLDEKRSVSIANVMLPASYLCAYELCA